MEVFDNPAFDRDDTEQIDDLPTFTTDVSPATPVVEQGQAPLIPQTDVSQQQQLLQTAVNDYYDTLASKQGLTPEVGRDTSKFELVDGRLRLKAYPNIDIINSNTGEPLAFSTIAGKRGGGDVIREELGFTNWKRTTAAVRAAAQRVDKSATDALQAGENIELRDMPQQASSVSGAIATLAHQETSFDSQLPMREILGLNEALKRTRGALVDNLAKLSQLDADITQAEQELGGEEAVNNPEKKQRIQELLNRLRDERSSRLEAAAANREALRTQFSRIRETVERVLNEDTTLTERLRTLFREQGVTIVSILTAIGMVVSTLVLALTGGSGGPPPPTPPAGKGGFKEWMKKHLQSLGRALAKLASKAAATLPGIIGSIVSWLLNLLAKTAGWLAENVWVVVLAVGGLLLADAREWFEKPKHA